MAIRDGDGGWRPRGRLFDQAAHDYQEGRPGYPEAVFTLLRERCGLGPGSRVLEIGPGSGQATMPILSLGARVTAVEPGAALADHLRARAGEADLQVIVARFEDAELPEDGFDLVVSATAFHWVTPDVGYDKAASALRDDGWLAVWWTIFGDPQRPDPFLDAFRPIVEAKAPGVFDEGEVPRWYGLDVAARAAEIEQTGRYGPVGHEVLPWEGRHRPAELRRLYSTFSNFLALPEALRNELLDDVEDLARDRFDGLVTRPYQTVMYLAQRRPRCSVQDG